MNKKILVTIGSRANFGRLETFIESLSRTENITVGIVIHGSALSDRYGLNESSLEKINEFVIAKLHTLLDSDTSVAVTKTVSNSTSSFADVLSNYQPDCVVVGGDRYEILAPAIASVMFSIPLIHIQGGEVTGNFDNKVRFCVSQLADYHFPSNEIAKEKLIEIGVDKERVFNLGCPGMDSINSSMVSNINFSFLNSKGTGRNLSGDPRFGVVIFHPETISEQSEMETFDHVFEASIEQGLINLVVFWPNADPGNHALSQRLREILEKNYYEELNIRVYKSFTPDEYTAILSLCSVALGNSSSLIREGSFIGVPSVLLGHRQKNRVIDQNILVTDNTVEAISASIKHWLISPRPKKSNLYGDGSAGEKISNMVSQLTFSVTGV